MDEESLYKIHEECEFMFSSTLFGLSKITMLRPLSNIHLQRSRSPKFEASISFAPNSDILLLTICDGVYIQLYDAIESHRQQILDAVFPTNIGIDVSSINVLETIYDLAVNFILQHELNHIFCGHFDYLRVKKGLVSVEYYMSESLREMDCLLGDLRSYYLEIEADNTAIEWMVERLRFKQLNDDLSVFLRTDSPENMIQQSTIMDLPQIFRDIGFRYLLVSAWLVICLMELNRTESVKEYNETHPLPAARLISIFDILMLYHARLSNLRISDSGKQTSSPSIDEVQGIRVYLNNILKPIIKSFINIESSVHKSPLVIPYGGRNFGEDLVNLLIDYKSLLMNEDTKSEVAIQINKIESVRSEILESLEEFRYMEAMKI